MYNKILVPLDGSDVAECVLPHVEAMAMSNDEIDITFLYVVTPLDTPLTSHEFKERIESEAVSAAHDYLKRIISKLTCLGKAHSRVILGRSAETILDYAEENDIDLIVMASHGLSGVSRWIRGSVVDKVLHESTVPVMRIRASAPRIPFYKEGQKMVVLVPLDGSELAETVLEHAKELAEQFGTQSVDIVLLRVCELFSHPHLHYPPPMSLSWDEYLKYETQKCKQICLSYLSGVKKRFKGEGIDVRTVVPVGSPAEAIVEYVNKKPVSLIVMSTHGRTGIGQWAFGSITNKVMKGTSTPALLIRCSNQ